MKRYITAYLLMFALGGAAPIALNPGSAGFDGGSVPSQILAPDGITTAPAYSFSTETGSGIWRDASGDAMHLQAETGLALKYAGTTTYGLLDWDSNLTDVSSDLSSPAIISTDADSGIVASSRIMNFSKNGAGIGSIRSSVSGIQYGGICLDDSGTAPCLLISGTGGGNFGFTTWTGGIYNGYYDLGDNGSISTSGSPGYLVYGDTDTGLGPQAGGMAFFGGGAAIYTEAAGITSAYSTAFFFAGTGAGAPSADPDCNADAERGRLYLDTTNSRLYVCGGNTRGWDHIVLTNDPAK